MRPTLRNGPGQRHLSGIATKITGIVFWGLVVTGLGLAVVLLGDLQRQTVAQYHTLTDEFAGDLRRTLEQDPGLDPQPIARRLRNLRTNHKLSAMELRLPHANVVAGVPSPDDYAVVRTIHLGSGAGGTVGLRVYYPNLDNVMAQQRKRLLITMGAAFLLFGFVLQWVLQRVLTKPIMGLVATAQEISDGDNSRRFDELAADELGFLAKFINKSLDYLTAQRNELSEAVQRIRQSEAELFQEKERAVVTLHSIGDAVITTDAGGFIEYLNPVAERLAGLDLSTVRGSHIERALQIVDENTGRPMENPVVRCLRSQTVIERGQHTALRRPDGRQVAIADSAAPIHDRKGRLIGAIMVFQDVTPTRKLARQLTFQATHDSLTGLFNRHAFENQVKTALESARRERSEHVLCYLDLDQFKIVNDTCGHVAGDELLRHLAGLLRKTVRDTDVIARLGGDEIGILFRYCALDEARSIADGIRAAIKAFRFAWQDHTFEIGACIGVVPVTNDSRSVADLLSAADMACYAAKDLGRNRVHVYQPDDRELERRRGEMRWASRITEAIDENRLSLYYQPVVALDGNSPPLYELMVRLREQDGRLVPPMAFIPAAERYGLMSAIDRWVVAQAFGYVSRAAGCGGCACTINLSGQSLGDETFLSFVVGELERTGCAGERICFEITETAAVANLAGAAEFIATLRARGCRFALDDFGSGLSSFAYLKNLKVDFLKMDGGFVRDMLNDPVDRAMVEAVNHIGHVMGIRTIAEFVEDQQVLDALRELGVDYGQGFHIAEPRPMDQWQEFVPADRLLAGANIARR
ncbi:MAG: EAL domain-containing protein [Gammaproteobacteria bacterium]